MVSVKPQPPPSFAFRSLFLQIESHDNITNLFPQNPGERNFHIFYEMIAGLSTADKAMFGLTKANDFFYLNQVFSCINYFRIFSGCFPPVFIVFLYHTDLAVPALKLTVQALHTLTWFSCLRILV